MRVQTAVADASEFRMLYLTLSNSLSRAHNPWSNYGDKWQMLKVGRDLATRWLPKGVSPDREGRCKVICINDGKAIVQTQTPRLWMHTTFS